MLRRRVTGQAHADRSARAKHLPRPRTTHALVAPAMAILAAFATCLGGTLWVVPEIPAAYMATFFAGLGSALGVFRKVTFTTSMSSHNHIPR